MAWEYTRKERETINRAWSEVMYVADHSMSEANRLRNAERVERRERSSLTAARALLLECIFNLNQDGESKPEPTAAQLASYSDGCMIAACIGAAWRQDSLLKQWHARDAWVRAEAAARDAIAAHRAYINRGMASV